jgi:hypothetical protein
MVKQMTQADVIMNNGKPYRFRLGALCALKAGPAQYPHGEQKIKTPLSKRKIKANYKGKALFLIS